MRFPSPQTAVCTSMKKQTRKKIIQLNIFSKVDIDERFASSLLLTPSEEVELLQCLYRRCESVIRFRTLLTPSEGVGHSRVFLTPLEGVELPRCLYRRCESVIRFRTLLTPSEGVGHTRVFLTPLEGVELLQCLYRRCESVIRFRTLLTPSEGVGHTRVFLTPLEGVELLRCLRMLCLCPQQGVRIDRREVSDIGQLSVSVHCSVFVNIC